MNTYDPNDPIVILRRELGGRLHQYAPAGHKLAHVLRALFPTRGGKASVDHFMQGRRTLSGPMWARLKMSNSWQAMPAEIREQLEQRWAASYRAPSVPKRQLRTEKFTDVLARWEGMVDQLAMELITPEQFKAEMRRVLGRQGERRRRL